MNGVIGSDMAKADMADSTDKIDAGDAPLIDLNEASIKKLISRAKKKGYITYDQLNEALPQDQMSSEQIEDIMEGRAPRPPKDGSSSSTRSSSRRAAAASRMGISVCWKCRVHAAKSGKGAVMNAVWAGTSDSAIRVFVRWPSIRTDCYKVNSKEPLQHGGTPPIFTKSGVAAPLGTWPQSWQ